MCYHILLISDDFAQRLVCVVTVVQTPHVIFAIQMLA